MLVGLSVTTRFLWLGLANREGDRRVTALHAFLRACPFRRAVERGFSSLSSTTSVRCSQCHHSVPEVVFIATEPSKVGLANRG